MQEGTELATPEAATLETPPEEHEPSASEELPEPEGQEEPEPAKRRKKNKGKTDADGAPIGRGADLSDEEIVSGCMALLFASPDPLSTAKLADLLEDPPKARVEAAMEALKKRLKKAVLPVELRSIAGGWQLFTAPTMGEVVARLFKQRKVERVSPAALETLAIVAYRQPVTKAEIEAIRGVQVGPILRSLVDRGLVRVTGRADVPGHPLQYGTTRSFLDRFGLSNVSDLPRDGELSGDS